MQEMMIDTQDKTVEQAQEELMSRLDKFAGTLSNKVSEQARLRSDVEQRWLKDLRQFHGEYDPEDNINKVTGSKLFVNITRNKTNAGEARLQDMLFPTDDKNWAIKPTPLPELAGYVVNGEEDAERIKAAVELEAKKKAERMQTQIDDQLNESRYPVIARDVIHDAAQCGTGIIKGPVVVGRTKRSWTQENGVTVLDIEEDTAPAAQRVDYWNFYPDMSARTVDECEFFFEKHWWTKKQLREFAKLPGVIKPKLNELVRTGAGDNQTLAKDFTNDLREITGVNSIVNSNRYEVWEYTGPISKDELFDALEASGAEEEDYEEAEGLDDEIYATVFFSGNSVLKVSLNPMDTQDQPYSVFNWEKDESCIFGFGIPYLMRNPQKIINASWRMMMDNAGQSVADQTVVNRSLVEPADGKWALTPKKVWYTKDGKNITDIRAAFQTFSTPSHQAELYAIFTAGRQLADEETNLPLIAQGEQSAHVTKTSSGMQMLMNSSNIVLRRAVKNWDDDVTRTMITRFYDWNMQFNEDESIKGDFKVDARGSGALLVKEKQQENLMIYGNLSASNPELAMRRDWVGLDKEIARALEVPHDKLTLSEEEIKRKQEAMQQQGNPEAQAAQMQAQLKQAEMQLKQQESQMKMQMEQAKLQQEGQLEMMRLQQERELRIAEIAERSNITIKQLEAKIGIELQKEQSKRDIAAGKITNDQTKLQLQAQNLSQGNDTF